jgi:hypothetical protein
VSDRAATRDSVDAIEAVTVGEDELDALAEAVFGTPAGRARVDPLLRRWEVEVGPIHEDDPHHGLWQAIRLDWALCDAEIDGGRGRGDTWAARAAAGLVDGIEPDPRWRAVSGTVVGLFEVWPSDPPFLRDRLRGACMPLHDAVRLVPVDDGPAALWEVRVCIGDGHAHLCRSPLPYPLELLPLLEQANADRFAPGGAPLRWSKLRRGWFAVHRARRADPAAIFERILATL